MLLQHIIGQLDAELARLAALRKIVAGLEKANPVISQIIPKATDDREQLAPAATDEVVNTEVLPARRVRAARVPSERRSRRAPAAETTALGRAIPGGPVVVSAEALARERATRVATTRTSAEQNKAPHENAETLTRNLSARWLSGPKPGTA